MLALGVVCSFAQVHAAEIRGTVKLAQAGLFGEQAQMLDEVPVSVALYPMDGQPIHRNPPLQHDIILSRNRIQPLYLAVKRGDRVRFNSQDALYHEIFSHSDTQPLELKLGRAGSDRVVAVSLNEAADLHLFCRIHARSYARIDVLDTALVRMIRAGETFEFRDLPPGNWRVRVAAPGAETRFVETVALTAPPALDIQMTVKGFARQAAGLTVPKVTAVEQLFPSEPGL